MIAKRVAAAAGLMVAAAWGCAMSAAPMSPPAVPVRLVAEAAPSGTLRAAINVGNVVLAKRGGPQGATGVSVDIANELGRRLRVPVQLIVYDTAGAVVERQKDDRWDIAFMGIDPGRAADITFTAPYVVIEGTYLVRDGSAFAKAGDLDRLGVRIAVGRGTAYDLYLSRAIKQATLVRFDTSTAAIEHFRSDGLEAAAGIREALVAAQKGLSGTWVLPDSFNRIEQAVAIPKSRPTTGRYVSAMVEELKAKGFVRAALDRNGQKGALVAPRTVVRR